MPGHSRRLKMLISYDGTSFCGWQRQNHDISIQGEIEKHLCIMTGEQVNLHGAGRTDKGVHAIGMVAHFDTHTAIDGQDFKRGLNSMMTGAIRIKETIEVPESFHARFSALKKTYTYRIYTGEVQPPEIRLYTLHNRSLLDLSKIEQCLKLVIGTLDFSSFENSGTRDKTKLSGRGAVRTIFSAELGSDASNQSLSISFTGDGFLRNMVRNLVGTLLEVGRGKISTAEFESILHLRDRSAAGPTAPAHGLFLKEIFY